MVYSDEEILKSFEQSKDKVISFFNRISKDHGFNNDQTDTLVNSVKYLIYFLKMDKTERLEAEIQYNKENRSKIKDRLKRLKKFYSANQDLVDEIAPWREKERFHKIIQHKIDSLEESLEFDSKSRAGENKIVVFALMDLIYCFEDFDFPRTKQIDIVYELFKEFDFDDYGKETHTKEILIGEPEQKERIRKYFQSPLLNERKELIKMNQYIQDNQDRLSNSPEAKEARDLIFGSSRS
jgi:uncharacterized protein YihD (DUF1040 family)